MYYVYGKQEGDKQFKPINAKGVRVKKSDAEVFQTREEALEFVDKHQAHLKPGAELSVRKG